jgi:uncharacterized SAM-binding protein YcdF (DUF218 family)
MRIIKLLLSIITLAWIGGFFFFDTKTKNFTLDTKTVTEAIVVFGSGKNGLYTGSKLLRLGYAPIIYTTGRKPAEEYNNFLQSEKLVSEQFIFDISFAGHNDFAKETATFLQKYHIDSIRLVIPSEQVPRAVMELKHQVPVYKTIIIHPISRKNNSYNVLFIEYNKFLITYFASYFGFNEVNLPYS